MCWLRTWALDTDLPTALSFSFKKLKVSKEKKKLKLIKAKQTRDVRIKSRARD